MSSSYIGGEGAIGFRARSVVRMKFGEPITTWSIKDAAFLTNRIAKMAAIITIMDGSAVLDEYAMSAFYTDLRSPSLRRGNAYLTVAKSYPWEVLYISYASPLTFMFGLPRALSAKTLEILKSVIHYQAHERSMDARTRRIDADTRKANAEAEAAEIKNVAAKIRIFKELSAIDDEESRKTLARDLLRTSNSLQLPLIDVEVIETEDK